MNEEGTEAAAATAILMQLESLNLEPCPTPRFVADHPFMFAIIHTRNKVPLFTGHVAKLGMSTHFFSKLGE